LWKAKPEWAGEIIQSFYLIVNTETCPKQLRDPLCMGSKGQNKKTRHMNKFRTLSAFMLLFLAVAPSALAQTTTSSTVSASTTASSTITAAMLSPVLTALGGVLNTLSTRISTQGVESIPNRPAVSQILGNIASLLVVFSAQLGDSTVTVTGTTAGTTNTGTPGFPNTGDGPRGIQGWEMFVAVSFLAGAGLLVKSFRAR
jgi:hypothetical protein